MIYHNPIIPGFHPDPSICRVGDDYYLVTSSFEYFPGVPLFHSRDLVNWRQVGHCLTRPSQLDLTRANASGGIYAPTIRHHEGRFYLTTTNVSGKGNFLVWSEKPEGPWSDPLWIDFPGIDSSLFFDDDGSVYYTGTGGMELPQGIYGFPLEAATGKILAEPRLIWAGSGGAYPEGPHLYKVGGTYYLMISEGGTEHGHMVTCARGASPLGPFEPCPHNPILTNRSLPAKIKAVGHADLVQTKSGEWWAVCLGIRPVAYPEFHNLGRETFLAKVEWSDGWPVVGNQGTLALEMEGPAGVSQTGTTGFKENFDALPLNHRWNFLRNPNAGDWSLAGLGLTLTGSPITLDDQDSPAFVGHRQTDHRFTSTVLVDFEPGRENEEAGLTVLQNNKHHYDLAIVRSQDRRQLRLIRRIGSLTAAVAADLPQGPVTLGIEATDLEYQFFYQSGDNGERIFVGGGEARYLSTEVGGAFTGVFLGLYATGNGKKSTAAAHFVRYRYESV